MLNEQAIKCDSEVIANKHGIKSYLFLYLDGDKARFFGNVSVATLMPLLMKYLAERKT